MSAENTNGNSDFFAGLVQDHARIEAQLEELMLAVNTLTSAGKSSPNLEATARTLDFFSTEGARHEAIEERVLFPRIRSLPAFKQILSALEFQHGMNRASAQELSACVDRFAAGSELELRRLAVRFVEMHRGHAVAEERALFPLAASVLSPRVIAEMSREVRDRPS